MCIYLMRAHDNSCNYKFIGNFKGKFGANVNEDILRKFLIPLLNNYDEIDNIIFELLKFYNSYGEDDNVIILALFYKNKDDIIYREDISFYRNGWVTTCEKCLKLYNGFPVYRHGFVLCD